MSQIKVQVGLKALVFFGFIFLSVLVHADQSDTHQVVEGMDVYIGVIPAEVIQGHGSVGEKLMHGGTFVRRNRYHLVAALLDQTTGERITDARIIAHVSEPGMAIVEKWLEPMKVGDTLSYGNYFFLAEQSMNRISLKISASGKNLVDADFEYWVSK